MMNDQGSIPPSGKRITKDFPLTIKGTTDEGVITGYASVFGNVDAAGDIIAPGAFTRTLAAWAAKGRAVPVLWQHDAYDPIGVTATIEEDAKGLKIEARLVMEVQRARDALALAKAGALGGLSIGFSIPGTASDGQPAVIWDEEQRAAVFREVRLWEYSMVTFPANEEAKIEGAKVTPEWAEDLTLTLREVRDALRVRRDEEVLALLREIRSTVEAPGQRPDRPGQHGAALTRALAEARTLLRDARGAKEST